MASLQQLCMSVLTCSMEWQQDFLLLNSVDSSIANRMVARLLPLFELKPQHLTFFAGAATDLSLDGVSMKGSPDSAEWCQYAMYWRGLRQLTFKSCPRLKDEHLQALKHAPATLKHITLHSCVRVTLSALSVLPKDVSLHSLTFKNCASTGTLPQSLSAHSELTHLDLSGHDLSDSDITSLTPLTLLKSLDISGSKLSQDGIDQLSVLSALTFLDISWTLAHYPPPLSHLRSLRMDSCDAGGAWDFTYAVHASIHGGEGTLFAQIQNLSLNSCKFEAADGSQEGTELLVFLIQAAAKHLQEVSLQGIHFSVSCLTPIVQALPLAPRLKSLYLDDLGTLPPASLTPLQNLPMLSKLQLRTAAITHDSHLAEVARIPGLADLEISEADNVTDEGLASLLQSNLSASLTRLVLGSRRMRGHCDHVITLRPHDDQVQGDQVSEDEPTVGWAHLPRLVHLQLSAADADTVITQACTACTALQSLVITGGQVLPSSLTPAAALRALTYLEFSGGLPCTELIDTLVTSSSLRTVVLRCWIPEAAVSGNHMQVLWPPMRLKRLLQCRGGDFMILGAQGVLGEEGAWGIDVPWQGPIELGTSPPGRVSNASTPGRVRNASTPGGSSGKGGSRGRGAKVLQNATDKRSDKGSSNTTLRLRYSRATLLAMKSRPECNRGLRALGCAAVVPSGIAKSAW